MASKQSRKLKPGEKCNFSQESIEELSQNSAKGKSNRTKNYSADECSVLIKCCDKFHALINKNSSCDKDKNEKKLAWGKIRHDFDLYCKSNNIFVSTLLVFLHFCNSIEMNIIFSDCQPYS